MSRGIALLVIAFLPWSYAPGQIKLPKLISDGMVLQRDVPVSLWGWAAPDEKISLEFNQLKLTTTADHNGKWNIQLASHPVGGPFEMTFRGSNQITLHNIVYGDVWVCSGQSNMELGLDRVRDRYPQIVAEANNHNIRQFLVPDEYDFKHQREDLTSGEWKEATADNILKFSAVAYFFATELYTKYKIPIGLINSALGGSPAEAWMSENALKKFPEYLKEAQLFKSDSLIQQIEASNKSINQSWYAQLNKQDQGLKSNWSQWDINDTDWDQMDIPGFWASTSLGEINGVVWFRKKITIPASMTGKPARLQLGRIVDADSVFVNGVFAGTTSYQYPPRKYSLPPVALKEGENTIAIRVISNSGKGGFVLDKPYLLTVGTDTIDLKGKWKYKLGARMNPVSSTPTVRYKPEGLFNAMIHPLCNYSIKGFIWYQGESNTKDPSDYGALMKTLISDWRSYWKKLDLPFLFVQVANYMEPKDVPGESKWAELRQAQLNTLTVPHTGMAVTIDIGEWNDVHPLNKSEVGRRLALQAMKVAYGEKNITASGPIYQSIKRNGNKLILTFSSVNGGLETKGSHELKYFAIAGNDLKFIWANTKIDGNKIIVWSDNVPNPTVVRYAWADNPEGANLYNKTGLPASPFEAEVK